jgi:acetyltransferase-like isoleucine patch superfamily enzyme
VFGAGCIICAGSIFTTDIVVGSFVTFNLMCAITHDDVIGDFATLAPACNLSGNVHVGEGTDLGTKVSAIPGVRIGRWSIVGAGAVVTRDLPDNVTAVGVPAKVIKEHRVGIHCP